MAEEDSVKFILEGIKRYPRESTDVDLTECIAFLKDRKFKSRFPKHPENFEQPSASVNLDGFTIIDGILPAFVWFTKSFEVIHDDIITVSFPKTGSTWLQEIVWLITNDFDFKTAKEKILNTRVPLIEIAGLAKPVLEAQKRPRHYHTHFPYPLLPEVIRQKKHKLIYIMRNPKDTCISFYHMYKFVNTLSFKGDLKQYARMFMDDEVVYAPYDKRVLSFWERRNEGHILIVTYEELKKDPKPVFKKIANFLSRPFTEEQLEMLAEHVSFKSMAKLKTVNREDFLTDMGMKDKESGKFMRKGIIGDWKTAFDEETNRQFDEWIEERFGNSDIKFDFE